MALGCMSCIWPPLPSSGYVQMHLGLDREKNKRNNVGLIERMMDFDF